MISFETQFKPEQVGFDEKRIGTLNEFFEELVAKKKILSANYCLARDGKVFANNAIGKLSYREEDTRELRPDRYSGSLLSQRCSMQLQSGSW